MEGSKHTLVRSSAHIKSIDVGCSKTSDQLTLEHEVEAPIWETVEEFEFLSVHHHRRWRLGEKVYVLATAAKVNVVEGLVESGFKPLHPII